MLVTLSVVSSNVISLRILGSRACSPLHITILKETVDINSR